MAPAKRARPSFSPPRPKKSKSTNVSTSTKGREASWKDQKNAALARKRATPTSKYSGRKGTRKAQLSNDDEDEFEDDSRNHRSALSLVDASASEAEVDDEDAEASQENESDGSDDHTNHDRSRVNLNSSPEPDMILAEITTTSTNADAPIPEQVVHKMLHHHFQKPEKTKISTDARDLVTRYLEVFVREAVMRSAYERQEKDGDEDGGGAGGGFLEVEDLERAAVQLCLDF